MKTKQEIDMNAPRENGFIGKLLIRICLFIKRGQLTVEEGDAAQECASRVGKKQ